MKTWEIWRVLEGRGLVDFLGTVDAASEDKALAYAHELVDVSDGEHLEVQEEDDIELEEDVF